jgi:hypothetical protein
MKIIITMFCMAAVVLLAGCASHQPSQASVGGTVDAYSQSYGQDQSDLQYPEGDYRNILSANPF